MVTAVRTSPTAFGSGRLSYLYDLLRELVSRDIKILYKRSALGIVWSLLNPLMQLAVFYFIFQMVFRLKIPHYPSFVFSGMLVWNWYSSSLYQAATAITGNPELIRKPGFSTPILPVVTVTTQLVHFLLALPILIVFLLAGGGHLTASVLLLPLLLALQFFLTLGIAYFVATLNVLFRDTQHLLGVLLLLQFYLTPIFYSASTVPTRFQMLYRLNPMVRLVEAYRTVLLSGNWPDALPLLTLAAGTALLLFTGYQAFIRTSYRFAEEM